MRSAVIEQPTSERAVAQAGPRVTAIVPTMALSARGPVIRRCVDSLLRGSREPVSILVVVNGNRFDPATVQALGSRPHVEVLRVAQASLPNALRVGRESVRTELFCFLDDDDEYLPGAIDRRVAVLDEHPECDFVVTAGYRHVSGTDERIPRHFARVEADPMTALFESNWLASCGGLFRTSRVGTKHFQDIVPYLEWTWIAFSLCNAGCRVLTLDEPTYRVHDTADSASKSRAYGRARGELYCRMRAANPSVSTKTLIARHQRDVLHSLASSDWRYGDLRSAWINHLATLRAEKGWRYLPFTRYLVVSSLKSLARHIVRTWRT